MCKAEQRKCEKKIIHADRIDLGYTSAEPNTTTAVSIESKQAAEIKPNVDAASENFITQNCTQQCSRK